MAIDRDIRLILEQAKTTEPPIVKSESNTSDQREEQRTGVTIREVYDRLVNVRDQTVVRGFGAEGDVAFPELLALVGERAVAQQDFHVAERCVGWFLRDYSIKNQFFCRIQLVRAQCASHNAGKDTGAVKLRKTLNAIHFVTSILPIAMDAKRRPHYDFLIYNSSVTYWQIARNLMKTSTFQYLTPSLITIVEALKQVGERDLAWVIRLQLALVHAFVDAKQFAAAAKTINDVVDVQLAALENDRSIAISVELKALYEEALRVQLHVGSFKDAECQKIIPNVKKSIPAINKRASMLTKLQVIKSGAFVGSLQSALVELFQEATGITSFAVAATTDEVIIAHIQALDNTSAQGIDAEIVVEAGIFAVFQQELRVAQCCDAVLQTRGKSVGPKVRVLHQVLRAVLTVFSPLPLSIQNNLSLAERHEMIVRRRVEGAKALERALLASKRQQDPNLVEAVCIYAWNLSLPLLQLNLRSQVSRLLSLAASSLDELQSMILVLRVRIMLEVGKLEMASEFIQKAHASVSAALQLDYGNIISSAGVLTLDELTKNEAKWARRAVDVHLYPLKQLLDYRLSVEDPTTVDEHLLSIMDQVRDVKDSYQRRCLLERATVIMEQALQEYPPSEALPDSSLTLLLHMDSLSSLVWSRFRDGSAAKMLVTRALGVFFSGDSRRNLSEESAFYDKSVMVIEVNMRMRLIEIMSGDLMDRAKKYQAVLKETNIRASKRTRERGTGESSKGAHHSSSDDFDDLTNLNLPHGSFALGLLLPLPSHSVDTRIHSALSESQVEEIRQRQATIEEALLSLKKSVLQEFSLALHASARVGWSYVVENTSIYLWNYHFQVFRLLLEPPTRPHEKRLSVTAIMTECIAAMESALAAVEGLNSGKTNVDLIASLCFGLALAYEKMGKLDKASALADSFLKRKTDHDERDGPPLVALLHLKRCAELKIRCQLQQNVKDIHLVEILPELKIVSLLESMEWSLQQSSGALPPPQQAAMMDKAQGFYQKALSAWQSVASEVLTCLQDKSVLVENQQQRIEVFAEIWVRLGCGALRLQQAKVAIDCGDRALQLITVCVPDEVSQRTWFVDNTWKWLSTGSLLCGRSVLTLLSGESAAWSLIDLALQYFVSAAEFATRIGAAGLVHKAAEGAWNAIVMAIRAVEEEKSAGEGIDERNTSTGEVWQPVVAHLSSLVLSMQHPQVEHSELKFFGAFVLLCLDICELAQDWNALISIADNIMLRASEGSCISVPPDILKDIATAHAIASAKTAKVGSGASNATGIPKNSNDPYVQARILKRIAFSSSQNPPAQLKSLSGAHKELDGTTEEQALLMLDMAEWYFSNHFPHQDFEAQLNVAHSVLLRGCTVKHTGIVNYNDGATRQDASSSDRSMTVLDQNERYSQLWYLEKLLRLSIMRLVAARSMPQRWEHIRAAQDFVFGAWKNIVDAANESDLRERYAQAHTEGVAYGEWVVDKQPKFATPNIMSVGGWIAFYQQITTSPTSRFYMQWITPLRTALTSNPNTLYISHVVLTLSYLEYLIEHLQDLRAYHLLLPVICLYQILYFAYCPQKSKTVEVWIELTLYDALEHLNLPMLSVPLQNALEILQACPNIVLKELQQHIDQAWTAHGAASDSPFGRRRAVVQVMQLDVTIKAHQAVGLLLKYGYVHQGKLLLTMIDSTSNLRGQLTSDAMTESSRLWAMAHEIEGRYDEALTHLDRIVAVNLLSARSLVDASWMRSGLIRDKKNAMEQLLSAERKVAGLLLKVTRSPLLNSETLAVTKYLASMSSAATQMDLDLIMALAELKMKRGSLILTSGTTSENIALAQALTVFREGVELLAMVGSKIRRADACIAFSKLLLEMSLTRRQQDWSLYTLEARSLVLLSLNLLEEVNASLFEPDAAPYQEANEFIIPLHADIADVKLLITTIELRLEESASIIRQEQMTWYNHDQISRQTIVQKWLDETGQKVSLERPGSISRAFALAMSAKMMLSRWSDCRESMLVAQVLEIRCDRLRLYHSADGTSKSSLLSALWTNFSADGAKMSWVCAANHELSLTTTDGFPQNVSTSDTSHLDKMDHLRNELETHLKSAIDRRFGHVLQLCAYELVQVCGCRRPWDAIRHLLLYQSVVVRDRHVPEILEQCLAPTHATALHLRRHAALRQIHYNPERNSLPFQLSQLFLDQQSEIAKRMTVNVAVDTVVAGLPPTLRVMSLQLSPDQCFLYVCIAGHADKAHAVARMEWTETKMSLLVSLTQRIRTWRQEMTKTLLAAEEQQPTGQDAHEFHPPESSSSATSTEASVDEAADDTVEADFVAIVEGMVDLFSPIFDHPALRSVLETELHGSTLILLPDRVLSILPLEALPALGRSEAIARDLSLHLLHHRLQAVRTHPFRRDDMRVLVDPRKEDEGLGDQTLSTIVLSHTRKAGAALSTWKDAVEHGQLPTPTDWQQAMLGRRAGGILYAGPNRALGSGIALSALAGMSLGTACYALVLLDRAENTTSARRQSKLDSDKPPGERELEEDPYRCALLCALCGINVLVLNQWTMTFHSTRRLANALLTGLGRGQSLAKAIRKAHEASAPVLPATAKRPGKYRLKARIRYSPVVFGLGHLTFKD